MHIQQNVSLKLYSTMRLGGEARFVCTITNDQDLIQALEYAHKQAISWRVIGLGSNIIWRDEGYSGLLIVNAMTGFSKVDDTTLTFGAGNSWDDAVNTSVKLGLSGLETLSLIPGKVGATPVQNVGAYGQEIANVMKSLRAYDTQQKQFVIMKPSDCQFGYRTSRFKTAGDSRFIIVSVTFGLTKQAPTPPFYESLQVYLDKNNITTYTPATIRDAVIAVRTSKLPDPSKVANNGSFFANPIITGDQYNALIAKYPDIKAWPLPNNSYKLAAGWLVEKAGFNNMQDTETGMATWAAQNLVIVNQNARTTAQLITFTSKIVGKVQDMFNVTLQQEPELLP